jgi:hypothetical protein
VFPSSGSARAIHNSGNGKLNAYGNEAPTDGESGYAPGCEFIDAANGKVYINEGTNTSCAFKEVLTTPDYAETAADRGPSPLIWDNCPILEYTFNPVKGSHYFEDFKGDIYGATNSTTRMKGLTFFNDNGPTHQIVDDDVHGVLRVEGNDADSDDSAMAYGHDGGVIVPTAGKKFWFEARVRRDTVSDNELGMFIGLGEEGLCAADSLDVNSADLVAAKDWLGFHVDLANGDAIDFVHGDGVGEAVVAGAAVAVPVAAEWDKLGMYCDGTTVFAYHDGVLVDSVLLSASDMPLGEELAMYWIVKNGDAGPGEHKASIDWWRLAVEY